MADTPSALAAAFVRVDAGEPLSLDDAHTLLSAPTNQRAGLLGRATDIRNQGLQRADRPAIITYSRKVFVPLTTLCRDRCHYCIFVDTPAQLLTQHKQLYMSPEQVLAVVRQGQALGCKEALLTLGDRPEDRWPQARAWLDEHGYTSTLDYVGRIAALITAETGMLVHLNPGVMTAAEMVELRPVAPSMGMMLETTSRELFATPGQVHYGSPDKDPAIRMRVIDDTGRLQIPFTTGILVGIGESFRDRAESLIALRDAHARHGHLQEIIVQNFRAKPRTAMRDAPDAGFDEYLATVATARLVFGPDMRIQVPPNLSDPTEFDLLVRAGVDDWGGVSPLTADHVNPERPWPHLDDLARRTAELGFTLRERLTAHPEFVRAAEVWIDPALHGPVAALADSVTGLARPAEPKPTISAETPRDAVGFSRNGGSGQAGAAQTQGATQTHGAVQTLGASVTALVDAAANDPAALDDAEWVRVLLATGADLDHLAVAADDVRRYTVGEAISIVVNRNLTSTGLARRPTTPAEFTLSEVAAISQDAWELGATELCVQGRIGSHEDPAGYLELVRVARDAAPGIQLHAYRPQDVCDFADRTGIDVDTAVRQLIAAGVHTMPGTGVKLLSERVRHLVAPADLDTARWRETITAAHHAGVRTSSVMFYGHVETAAERIAHIRELRRLQDAFGGFTEFVPIPLPSPAGGIPLLPERSPLDEHRAMVAVSRLMLSGAIAHIQIPWPRLGLDHAVTLMRCGGDDWGGTLEDGRVRPETGIEHGLTLPLAHAARLTARMHRPLRQRSTDYREASRPERAPRVL